tara:strand:- start:262 stop:384 length:123 start_codon:yes stop_codon:yes gene_type:complete
VELHLALVLNFVDGVIAIFLVKPIAEDAYLETQVEKFYPE